MCHKYGRSWICFVACNAYVVCQRLPVCYFWSILGFNADVQCADVSVVESADTDTVGGRGRLCDSDSDK